MIHIPPMGSDVLANALALAGAGLAIHPLRSDKRPHLSGWPDKATTNDATIREWWAQWPDALPGIVCGPRSGIDVLDIDQEGLPWLAANASLVGSTYTYETRSGGRHLIYQHRAGLKTRSRSGGLPGVDVRTGRDDGTGAGYVVFWPAVGHRVLETRSPTRWRHELFGMLADAPAKPAPAVSVNRPSATIDAPADAIQHPRRYALAALESAVGRIASAQEGSRNDTLNREAHPLARFIDMAALTLAEVVTALTIAALKAGLTEEETVRTLCSALQPKGAAA